MRECIFYCGQVKINNFFKPLVMQNVQGDKFSTKKVKIRWVILKNDDWIIKNYVHYTLCCVNFEY